MGIQKGGGLFMILISKIYVKCWFIEISAINLESDE